MSRSIERKSEHEDRKHQSHDKRMIADERGWSGQHGQHAVSEEERNYGPNQRLDADGLGRE